ncbi:unnamed protein product, partial [Choristocarpus tenellus]
GGEKEGGEEGLSEMLGINSFLFRAGVDNINMFKVQRYMQRSYIAKKVMGFMDLTGLEVPGKDVVVQGPGEAAEGMGSEGGATAGGFVSRNVSALQKVQGFLKALTNASR